MTAGQGDCSLLPHWSLSTWRAQGATAVLRQKGTVLSFLLPPTSWWWFIGFFVCFSGQVEEI